MKLRLQSDDLSLQEMAARLSEVLGKEVSRSNVNHLFRAIHQQALQYEDANNDSTRSTGKKN